MGKEEYEEYFANQEKLLGSVVPNLIQISLANDPVKCKELILMYEVYGTYVPEQLIAEFIDYLVRTQNTSSEITDELTDLEIIEFFNSTSPYELQLDKCPSDILEYLKQRIKHNFPNTSWRYDYPLIVELIKAVIKEMNYEITDTSFKKIITPIQRGIQANNRRVKRADRGCLTIIYGVTIVITILILTNC